MRRDQRAGSPIRGDLDAVDWRTERLVVTLYDSLKWELANVNV